MAQLINITSEALQRTVRQLLPSQQGFGEDLQATNVVTPIIDLTPTAEGSKLPPDLQSAMNFGGMSSFFVINQPTGVDILSNSGFWRFFGVICLKSTAGGNTSVDFRLVSNGVNKSIFNPTSQDDGNNQFSFDFVVFLQPGEKVNVIANNANAICNGNYRQLASVNGTLTNPVGFSFE